MLKPGNGFGLDLEAGEVLAANLLTGQESLERDDAFEVYLACLVDNTHAAAAELTQDLVTRNVEGGLEGLELFGFLRGRGLGGTRLRRSRPGRDRASIQHAVHRLKGVDAFLQFRQQIGGIAAQFLGGNRPALVASLFPLEEKLVESFLVWHRAKIEVI